MASELSLGSTEGNAIGVAPSNIGRERGCSAVPAMNLLILIRRERSADHVDNESDRVVRETLAAVSEDVPKL